LALPLEARGTQDQYMPHRVGSGSVRLIENFGGLFLFMFICPIQASEAAKWLSMLPEWTKNNS